MAGTTRPLLSPNEMLAERDRRLDNNALGDDRLRRPCHDELGNNALGNALGNRRLGNNALGKGKDKLVLFGSSFWICRTVRT